MSKEGRYPAAYQVWFFDKQDQKWIAWPDCLIYHGPWEKAVSYCSILGRQLSKLRLKKIHWSKAPVKTFEYYESKREYEELFEKLKKKNKGS
tara:strand:- start:31 stop:306 length:276 start_codon:yes stop_codon:yes gene_type:complete